MLWQLLQKRRKEVLERDKQIISQLNDLSEVSERVRRDKDSNKRDVEKVEGPQRKIAKPSPDSDKSL